LNSLGKHLLLELYDCDQTILDNLNTLRDILLNAAIESGATVLGESFHQFSPCGISGVVIIAESHLTIHTWPEYGYAAADIFTCGTTVKPEKAAEVIIERMHPQTHAIVQMLRGNVEKKHKVSG
jgi:S-adenosylmethionine decarboxylase